MAEEAVRVPVGGLALHGTVSDTATSRAELKVGVDSVADGTKSLTGGFRCTIENEA